MLMLAKLKQAWRRLAERAGRGPARSAFGKRAEKAGYSLLEILIVLTIIGLIATFVGPRLLAQLDRSKVTAARVQIRAISSAIETMHLDIGRYPSASEGLNLLVQAPQDATNGWAGPYLDNSVPSDPWRRPYVYEPPTSVDSRPRVLSLGADGQQGGSGNAADIASDDPA